MDLMDENEEESRQRQLQPQKELVHSENRGKKVTNMKKRFNEKWLEGSAARPSEGFK